MASTSRNTSVITKVNHSYINGEKLIVDCAEVIGSQIDYKNEMKKVMTAQMNF